MVSKILDIFICGFSLPSSAYILNVSASVVESGLEISSTNCTKNIEIVLHLIVPKCIPN